MVVHLNLLAFRPIAALMRWRFFPPILQLFALVGLVALIANGYGAGRSLSPEQLVLFRKTNLTTLSVWGLWWPGVIGATVLLGRVWCTVCPLELVHRLADGCARTLAWRRLPLAPWLQAGWLSLVFYLLMQLAVAGFSIHRVPHLTAIVLLTLLGLAWTSALIFQQSRSFCRAFCPASALLSVYSRFTPIQLSRIDAARCNTCTSLDCVKPSSRLRFDRRSCPSHLRPFDRAPSDGCVLCFQCAKVCPKENIGWGVVDSTASVRAPRMLEPFEGAFVLVAAGFVTHELIGEVAWAEALFHRAPATVGSVVSVLPFGWIEAGWYLLAWPALLWGLIAGLGRLVARDSTWRGVILASATGAAPLVAVGHLAKALAKLCSWAPYLMGALADPAGMRTFAALSAKTSPAPQHWLAPSTLAWLMLLVVALVGWRAWRAAGRLKAPVSAMAPARLASVAATGLLVVLLGLWTTGR